MNGEAIGRRMAGLRRERGLTRRGLAELSRLSQGQVSRLENGRQPFRSETLVRVAGALGVAPYRLLLPADGEERVLPPRGLGGALLEALRAPEFVSLLEDIARAFRTAPGSFRAVESVAATVLGTRAGHGSRGRSHLSRASGSNDAFRSIIDAVLVGKEDDGKGRENA